VPTARASALAPAVSRALAELGTALRGAPAAFDPATAHRTFHLATSDYVELLLLPKLAERLARIAPGVDLWAHAMADHGDRELASGEIDLVLGLPRSSGRGSASIYEKQLFTEKFRCVVRADHPLASAPRMTLARYCGSAHVLVAPRGRPGSFVDDALAAQGRTRRIALAVPHFLVVPHVLATTDLVATLASRIVALYRDVLGLVDFAPPLAIPDFTIAAAWHERAHHDPAQRWLRDQVIAAAATL
jgi:DNA-binding transcriptional LysR family regulator